MLYFPNTPPHPTPPTLLAFQLPSFKGWRTQQKQRRLLYQLSQQGEGGIEEESERGQEESRGGGGGAGNEEGARGHGGLDNWEVEDAGKDTRYQNTKGRS